MKLLSELVEIVTRQRLEKVQTIDINELEDKQSQYAKFYNALKDGQVKSDQDAAAYFYDTDTSDDRYRKLKSRFKKRLLNYLFFLDINKSSYSDYHNASHTCHKNLMLCRILKANGARYSFEKLAKQTLHQALKYNLNSITVPLTNDLLTHYSFTGKSTDYHKTLHIYEQANAELNAEYEAMRAMEATVLANLKNRSREKQAEIAEQSSCTISKLREQFPDNYKLNYFYFYIHSLYHQIQYDFDALNNICQMAEDYYESHKLFYQNSILAQFSLMRMPALLNLRDTQTGLKVIKKSLQYFSEGKTNWILTMEFYFLLAMQAQRYKMAADIFLQVVNNSRFKYTQDIRKEKWRIFHAYLHYIFDVKRLDKRLLRNKYIPNFNASNFLNNIPHASSDKSGLNMAVITLQIQYLLKENQLDAIFDKMDALNIYAYRYLKKKENKRAYTYIRMLQTAEKKSFIPKYVKEETAEMHQTLYHATDIYSAEWEILPYEVMWEHALHFMQEAQ